MVNGAPCMCIKQTAQSLSATAAIAPGMRSAKMSLIIEAPLASATRITAGL